MSSKRDPDIEGMLGECMRMACGGNSSRHNRCVEPLPATLMARIGLPELAKRARSRDGTVLYKILISRRGSRGLNIMTSLYVNVNMRLCVLVTMI